jgi:hypothetical protein
MAKNLKAQRLGEKMLKARKRLDRSRVQYAKLAKVVRGLEREYLDAVANNKNWK